MKKNFFSDEYTYFSYSLKGPKIRVCVSKQTGEVWVANKDVCQYLGYVNPSVIVKRHCSSPAKYCYIKGDFGQYYMSRVLSPEDVLQLAYSCNRPMSKELIKWVSEKLLTKDLQTPEECKASPEEPQKSELTEQLAREDLDKIPTDKLSEASDKELLAKAYIVALKIIKKQQEEMVTEKKAFKNRFVAAVMDFVGKLQGEL